MFDNTMGQGYENAVAVNPYENKPETFVELARIMSSMWISFFNTQNPNANNGEYRIVPELSRQSADDSCSYRCRMASVYP